MNFCQYIINANYNAIYNIQPGLMWHLYISVQVFQPLWASTAGAECRHEHHHVPNDSPVREGETHECQYAGAHAAR